MKKYIKTTFESFVNSSNSSSENYSSINSFPQEIKDLLREYSQFFKKGFDWNSKMDEFKHSDGSYDTPSFNEWIKNNEDEGLRKNVDTVIVKISEDIQTLKDTETIEAKLKAFEELIIPSLGNEVLTPSLNKFQEEILMNPNATIEEIEDGMKAGRNIFDENGSIDQSKIEQSDIFVGGRINLANFERFVEKNPQFQGVFNDWEKLSEESFELMVSDLNAFRNSHSIEGLEELKDYLLEYKRNNNI
jgi:hypothetical protein